MSKSKPTEVETRIECCPFMPPTANELTNSVYGSVTDKFGLRIGSASECDSRWKDQCVKKEEKLKISKEQCVSDVCRTEF